MPTLIFITVIIIFGLLIIAEIVARVLIHKGKKKNLSTKSYDALIRMLNLTKEDLETGQEGVQIIDAKNYYYHPLKKIISINNFDSTTVHAHLASLHEAGHYQSVSTSKQKEKVTQFSTIIIAINRLIVIPFFIFLSYVIDFESAPSTLLFNLSTVSIFYFIFATILRVSFGLPEEYRASQIALEYIETNYDPKTLKFARNSYRAFFSQYLTQVVLLAVAIPFIYWIIFLS